MRDGNLDPSTLSHKEWAKWAYALIKSGLYVFKTKRGYVIRSLTASVYDEKIYYWGGYRQCAFSPKNWRRSLNLIEVRGGTKGWQVVRQVNPKKDIVPAWCFEEINLPAQTK